MTRIELAAAGCVLVAVVAGGAPDLRAAEGATAPAAAAEAKFSEAENRMWMTNQLESVTRPVSFTYSFVHGGTFEAGFEDRVIMKVARVNPDGSKALDIDFFSGERHWPSSPVDSATVNLVLSRFFEGDIREMNRLTDPDGRARERWRYFQRRIKLALAESAKVTPTEFEFDGRRWKGHEITFAPYVDDPHRAEFERFAGKRYSVVVSDELPGYLYRIETIVPGEKGATEPLLREVLQLSAVKPAG